MFTSTARTTAFAATVSDSITTGDRVPDDDLAALPRRHRARRRAPRCRTPQRRGARLGCLLLRGHPQRRALARVFLRERRGLVPSREAREGRRARPAQGAL